MQKRTAPNVFKIKILLIVLLNLLNAQTKNSLYSMFGVGQIVDHRYGINRSLGGTGLAFQSGSSINHLNPASYIGIYPNAMLMEAGIYGNYQRSQDGERNQYYKDINLNYFALGMELKRRWAVSFGVVPYSNIDYKIQSEANIGGELTSYKKIYVGSGGLNKAYWGNSFKVAKNLNIGFNTSYLFGSITESDTAITNSDFQGYSFSSESFPNNIHFDLGLQWLINKNEHQYTIGITYSPMTELNTTENIEFVNNGEIIPIEQDLKSNINIPQAIGAGISYKREDIFKVGVDYAFKNWSDIDFSNSNMKTRNSHRFSIGTEYGNIKNKGTNICSNFIYRLGAYYNKSYLVIDNEHINSKGINIGLGIPLNGFNTLNLSLEYGEEGTLSSGLVKNSHWGLYLNFSLYQFWANDNNRFIK